jgi:hypothetical protein
MRWGKLGFQLPEPTRCSSSGVKIYSTDYRIKRLFQYRLLSHLMVLRVPAAVAGVMALIYSEIQAYHHDNPLRPGIPAKVGG